MKSNMQIIYAKKFRFPNKSANVLQAMNMLAAFSACGHQVHSFFSFNNNLNDREAFLQNSYGQALSKLGLSTSVSQTARGLRYSLWLARRIMAARGEAVIFAREGAEVRRATFFRHLHLPKLPLFYEAHKLDFDEQLPAALIEQRREELSALLARMSGIIFVDRAIQEQAMEQFGLRVPSYVAPAGVDIATFGLRQDAAPSSEVVIAYFGKVAEDKGVMLLAETLRLLPERYRVRFVGEAGEEIKSRLLSVAGESASRIEFRGNVPQTALPQALEGAHISVIPLIHEGLFFSPLKLAESLAMGLPLVCTPIQHLKHRLQDGRHAIFAENVSPQALAVAIRALGESPDLMLRMQRENRAYAQQFSWEKRAQGIVEFMREVMEAQRRG